VNSLEEQIRAATRATAEEISWSDVPSQRARQSVESRAVGRQFAGSREFGRWAVPMAAAVAVVAVVGLASALTAGVSGHGLAVNSAKTGGPKAAHQTAAPAHPADLESGLIGLFVPATGAQYTTGALFHGEYQALEDEMIAKCMATYGFRVPAASPAQIAESDWDLTQFPDLAAIQRAGTLPSSAAEPSQESKVYSADLNRCSTASPSPFQTMLEAGTQLGASWMTIVTRIENSAPVLATMPELRACVAHYGWPSQPYGAPDSTINSFSDFVDWVAGHLDGAGSRAAPPAEMNALSRHWAVVFVQCARPAVAVMETQQRAAQKTFLQQNKQQFAALMAIARTDFTAAERQTGTQRQR
jgi:hypothetical protein